MKDQQNQYSAQQQQPEANLGHSGNAVQDKQQSLSSPSGRQTRQHKGFKGSVYLSILVEEHAQSLMHLLGYGFLVFAVIDYLYILIPPRLTDPTWEFQTIGALVEHAAIPLLGLMLVFFRHEGYVKRLEKNLLGLLSWAALLVGLVYLLMLPLGVHDTWRIYYATQTQMVAQLTQQTQPLQQAKTQLTQATTEAQIAQVLTSFLDSGRSPKIQNSQATKDQFLSQITQAERKLKLQADSMLASERRKLLKNAVKWHLGALVAGTLFVLSWHLSSWARKAY